MSINLSASELITALEQAEWHKVMSQQSYVRLSTAIPLMQENYIPGFVIRITVEDKDSPWFCWAVYHFCEQDTISLRSMTIPQNKNNLMDEDLKPELLPDNYLVFKT